MPPKFIDEIKELDPELHDVVSALAGLAMAPGALDGKTKTLITLALDALIGAKKGVEVLSKQARKLGASDQEIAEALRLAYFVAGNGVLALFEEAFDDDDDDDDDDDEDEDDKRDNVDDEEENEDEEEEDEEINNDLSEPSDPSLTVQQPQEDEYEIQEFPGIQR